MPIAEAPGARALVQALEVGAAGLGSRRRWQTACVQLSSKYACFLGETTVVGEILSGGGAWGSRMQEAVK